MFFIFGINQATKDLKYQKTVICSQCGSYGRYQVYMTCMCFSIFFIPIIRWNRRFFVRMSCCNTIYALNEARGKCVLRREPVEIEERDLSMVQPGRPSWNSVSAGCPGCGADLENSYQFCPQCGCKLKDRDQ